MSDKTLLPLDAKVHLEMIFRDGTTYLNYWDCNGEDVCCELRDGKLQRFVYTEDESAETDDPFKMEDITFPEFVERVRNITISRGR